MTEQPETDEQRADRLETKRAHAAGNHQYCGVTCEAEMPSDMLRNFILAKGYPGTAGALDELLRRAAVTPPDAQPATGSLREQYAAAIRPNMLMGLQDAELDGPGGTQRINEWVDWIAKELAAVRDREMEQMQADLKHVQERACSSAENLRNVKGRLVKLDAAIERVRAELDRWGLNTLMPQTMRALDDIRTALDRNELPKATEFP